MERVKEVDFAVPYDADYQTSYLTQQKGIIHLMPWGYYGGEYYWTLFNSAGDAQSPVVGVFADKSGNCALRRTRADPEWSAATTGWEAATKAAALMCRLDAERRMPAPSRLSIFGGGSTSA